jgi:hypothetical protein
MVRQTPGGIHRLRYGTTEITFEVVYSARKTLAISVFPDSAVIVKAPEGTTLDTISESVQRRAGWIMAQRRHFDRLKRPLSPGREYVSGEAYRYLGRQLRLKVVESGVARVTRSRSTLMVEVLDPQDTHTVGQMVEAWFDVQAMRIFAERLDLCYKRIAHWELPKPTLKVRPMKARWGSLTPKGTLSLNRKLIQSPTELIDYVILHELCHLRELNHRQAFYDLLDQVLPNWRTYRQQLNTYDFI